MEHAIGRGNNKKTKKKINPLAVCVKAKVCV